MPAEAPFASVSARTRWAGAAMLLLGLVGPSWGPALVPARAEFHLGLITAGTLVLIFGIARTAGSALAGAASDRLARRSLVLCYGVLLVGALAGVASSRSWAAVLAWAAGIGVAFGCLATEANAVAALGGLATRARDLNLVNAAYGLGASLGPLALGLLLAARLGWRSAFGVWALLAVVPLWGLALAVQGRAERPRPLRAPGLGALALARQPAVLTLAGMAFLYNGIGWTISTWAPTWLVTRFSAHLLTGAAGSTAFYACLTVGRLGDAALAARLPPGRVMWVQALGAGAALLGLALAPSAAWALVAFGAAGLALGGIYPNLVAQAAALHPERPGAMSGVIATGGSVGVSLVPFAAAIVGRAGGPQAMGWTLPVLGLALIGLARLTLRRS